ncbi:FAD-binding oxidoreductase [Rhodospirillaceae bacterium KN72]|uniref:FAD-binding oxidoreductase n=1 Tax=Pacificispira spongiicola TaxID=2729598 RepID=A0A7Y0E1P2_9PROT|nr:FAD-binding oxidoreductase [Pacificispira spongiicola]NMM45551.1 FAD-binding oxidoreductase [Pacificispira spongiicola]
MTDIAIIGGGVIGSAIAYFLAADPGFDGSVTVVERDSSYEFSTSARSVASIRQQFSTRENIAISRFGYDFLKNIGTHLAVDGDAADIQFRDGAYLFLIDGTQRAAYDRVLDLQLSCGAEVEQIEGPKAIGERFPWVNPEGLETAHLGLSGEGWFDGYGLTRAFRKKAVSLGVRYIDGEVIGIEREGARVTALKLADGSRLPAGQIVNAAGGRARLVAEMAGIDGLPVSPRKRCVFFCECRDPVPQGLLVIDNSGTYFRAEGNGFLTGRSPGPEENDPENWDYDVDYSQFEDYLWPTLANRVPAFEAIRQTSAWGCHYAMCLLDANAILGPHPEVENFFFANGFSGHGMQQSPAIGRGLAEILTTGLYRTIDLSVFGYDRVLTGTPLEETEVI